MEKKPGLVTATDWRSEIKIEAREQVFKSIFGKLKECSSPCRPHGMYMEKMANHAREQEMKLLKTAKSKEQYYSGLSRMLGRSENPREIASNQDCRAVIIKKEAFDSQPLTQMTNQPHHWAVRNPQNEQPAVPYELLMPSILQSTSLPHEQFYGQELNVRQTNQNFGSHNQRCDSPHNALNSPCQPQGVQSRVLGTHTIPEFVTRHPKVVKLQPNENLSVKAKEEVIGKDFHASTFLHKQLSEIEQHKQHQSLGVPAVPSGNSNAEEWHGQALSELRQLRKYLPLLKNLYEKTLERLPQVRQIELRQKYEHQKNVLQIMIKSLELPEDRIFKSCYTKDGFYQHMQFIWKNLKAFFVKWSMSLANKQQTLRGQPSLSQSHMNPVQQCDNVNPYFQLVNSATTTGSHDCSPRVPLEIGSLSSEAGCIQKCMLQKKQNSVNINQEFHSSWTQQNQKSTENLKASNRLGMCFEYHLNSKFSPQTLEASKLSMVAEQALPIDPFATFNERASPIPPSSTIGLGKNPTNPSNSQCYQGCNSLKLHDSKIEIQAQSHEMIRSSGTMTCQLAEPTTLGNEVQLSTETRPLNPSATFSERASPIPPSSTIGLGKNPTNPSNSRCYQGWNSLKLHDSKIEIQAQSHEMIRSSGTMTCQLAEPTTLGNEVQLPTKTRPHNPSATFSERASPIPPSSTFGLGKNPTNPSNSQCSQGWNSFKLHDSKTEIQARSHEMIRSYGTMTCQLAEPTTLGNEVQLPTETRPHNPSATFNERASPISPSSTIGLGKNRTNPSNSQRSQGCNSLKLHDSKTEIQAQSHEMIRSYGTMTCQLAEPTNLGNKVQLSTEARPHNRLLKAVESISNEALRVAVSEISSVMEDRITEPWCCEKETYLSFQDGCSFSSNLKRKINATTLNDMPSPCSVIDESELFVTSSYKKLKKMSDHALLEEMRKINSQFIETVLELDTDEKFNRQLARAGTVLRLSYRAATESKNSVLHSANTLKFPVLSIKLLLPLDYPEHYPVLLSEFDTAYGTEDNVLKGMSREAGLLLRRFLDANHDNLSLENYALAWNECARSVVSDYAKRAGGGSFSSRYGNWEDCVAAA